MTLGGSEQVPIPGGPGPAGDVPPFLPRGWRAETVPAAESAISPGLAA